jgi:hypothetical protein
LDILRKNEKIKKRTGRVENAFFICYNDRNYVCRYGSTFQTGWDGLTGVKR